MHDIICPDCGDRYLACDVAFDLSSYITPLLHENPEDEEDVLAVKFKFYADEDSIRRSTEPGNDVPLAWETPIGPNPLDPLYPYVVTADTLFMYICGKIKEKPSELEAMLDEIAYANQNNESGRFICNAQQANRLNMLYNAFFDCAKDAGGRFDLDDSYVNTAIKILLYINESRSDVTKRIVLKLRCYSEERNGYHVPDILFVSEGMGNPVPIRKCCRTCGKEFPVEFGYYKMMPVVLLGSHFSGKTSFLLAMYHTLMNYEPFTIKGSMKAEALENDVNLYAFDKNIKRFEEGLPPIKTDFFDVPILNIRVNNLIYSFIDWPGEKFIDESNRNNNDFIFDSRRVITHARHILFFIEPSQIDESLQSGEEHVRFATAKLIERLKVHLSFVVREKLRSVTYIINKADMLEQNETTGSIYAQFQGRPETDFFANGQWQNEQFAALERTIKEGYIAVQNPALAQGLANIDLGAQTKISFMPVAPYGAADNTEGGIVIHRGCLSGLPLVKILQVDEPLTKKSAK